MVMVTLPGQWSLITISQYNHSFHPMFPTDRSGVMEHAMVIVSPLRRSVGHGVGIGSYVMGMKPIRTAVPVVINIYGENRHTTVNTVVFSLLTNVTFVVIDIRNNIFVDICL